MWNPRKKIFYVIFIFYLINKFFFVFISLSLIMCLYCHCFLFVVTNTHAYTHTHEYRGFLFFLVNQQINQINDYFSLVFFSNLNVGTKKNQMYSKWLSQLVINNFFSCFRFIISFNHHHHQLLLDDHQQHHWHSSIISLFFCFQSHHIIDWNEKVHVRLCRFMEYVTLLFIFLFLLLLLLLLFFHILFWGEGRKKEKMFFRDQQFM